MRLLDVPGGRIAYESRGRGRPVVFVHAAIADSRLWDREVGLYGGSHQTVRFDLRGFGRSEPATSEFSTVSDLEALIAHLRLDRPLLVGCSVGGRVAIDYAVEHPQGVSGLLLVAPGLSGMTMELVPEGKDAFEEDDRRSQEVASAWARGDPASAFELLRRLWCPALAGPALELFRTMVNENLPEVFEDRSGRFDRATRPSAAERPGSITAPATVLVGEQDNPSMKYIARAVQRVAPGARVITVPRGDHLLNLSRPDAFDEALTPLLSDRR